MCPGSCRSWVCAIAPRSSSPPTNRAWSSPAAETGVWRKGGSDAHTGRDGEDVAAHLRGTALSARSAPVAAPCESVAPWGSAAPWVSAAEVRGARLRRTLGRIAMPGPGPQVQAVRVGGPLRLRPELLRQMVHCRVGIDGHRIELAHEVVDQRPGGPTGEGPGQSGLREFLGDQCGTVDG